MKTLLLPLVLLLLGLGGGVGAGLALAPAEGEEGLAAEIAAPCGPGAEGDGHGEAAGEEHGEAPPAGDAHAEEEAGAHNYVKLPNQFIVPLVEDGEVAGLMLMSLSVEVPGGTETEVAPIEPKIRDAFLRVLFDHANTGGFDGVFTAGAAMRPLRAALLRAAEGASGGLVTDVLIVEMVREDR